MDKPFMDEPPVEYDTEVYYTSQQPDESLRFSSRSHKEYTKRHPLLPSHPYHHTPSRHDNYMQDPEEVFEDENAYIYDPPLVCHLFLHPTISQPVLFPP
jgi:hypothetical protein